MDNRKNSFSKKDLQEGVDDYITQKGAGKHFNAQVHENDISKNKVLPRSCMAGVNPELDNTARNIAYCFGWPTSKRFDIMTEKLSALLKLLGVEVSQRPKEDNQSIRFWNVTKLKAQNWWYRKTASKAVKDSIDSDVVFKKIEELIIRGREEGAA